MTLEYFTAMRNAGILPTRGRAWIDGYKVGSPCPFLSPIRVHDDNKAGFSKAAIGPIYLTVPNPHQTPILNLTYETKCPFQFSDAKRETPYNRPEMAYSYEAKNREMYDVWAKSRPSTGSWIDITTTGKGLAGIDRGQRRLLDG